MGRERLNIERMEVEHGGRKRVILLPTLGKIDRGQVEEIKAWQKEKTLRELKELPERKPKHSAEEVSEALRERLEYERRHR
jgi:hypothetical protein